MTGYVLYEFLVEVKALRADGGKQVGTNAVKGGSGNTTSNPLDRLQKQRRPVRGQEGEGGKLKIMED